MESRNYVRFQGVCKGAWVPATPKSGPGCRKAITGLNGVNIVGIVHLFY
jgi:hypothetical protein